MQAIDDTDIGAFDRVKMCRNTLAHRLFATLGSDGMPPDFLRCLQEMEALIHKIELWWIKEVLIPTDPYFDIQDIDDNDITPPRAGIIALLFDFALGDERRKI